MEQIKQHPRLDVLVSSDGKIFHRGKWTFGSKRKSSGYCYIGICGKYYRVHRLVAETFLENAEGKPTVDHINRDTSDNRLENLRWATHHEQNLNSKNYYDRDQRISVSEFEDQNAYRRQYNSLHRDENRAYQREYYQRKKRAAV